MPVITDALARVQPGMLLASLLLLSGALVHAKPVLEGPARVVDGDTLYIGQCEWLHSSKRIQGPPLALHPVWCTIGESFPACLPQSRTTSPVRVSTSRCAPAGSILSCLPGPPSDYQHVLKRCFSTSIAVAEVPQTSGCMLVQSTAWTSTADALHCTTTDSSTATDAIIRRPHDKTYGALDLQIFSTCRSRSKPEDAPPLLPLHHTQPPKASKLPS